MHKLILVYVRNLFYSATPRTDFNFCKANFGLWNKFISFYPFFPAISAYEKVYPNMAPSLAIFCVS